MAHEFRTFNFAIGFALSALLVACSSATLLTVQSNPPKGSVFVKGIGKTEPKLLGQTPLVLDNEKLTPEMRSGPISIEIRKEGYFTSELLVTEITGLNMTINRELAAIPPPPVAPAAAEKKDEKPEPKPEDKIPGLVELNHAIDRLFEAQRLVRVGRSEEAMKVLGDLKTHYPNISAIYEMEGGLFFLSKKLNDALDSYRYALKFNPDNVESVRMTAIIEKLLGAPRPPASVLPPKSN